MSVLFSEAYWCQFFFGGLLVSVLFWRLIGVSSFFVEKRTDTNNLPLTPIIFLANDHAPWLLSHLLRRGQADDDRLGGGVDGQRARVVHDRVIGIGRRDVTGQSDRASA